MCQMRAAPMLFAFALALGLGMPASQVASAAQADAAKVGQSGMRTYIVVFDDAPLALFR